MSRIKLTVLGFLGFIVMLSVFRVSVAQATSNDQFRWDLISVNFANGTVSAGGHDSAKANDGSEITLTGSGTFLSNSGNPQPVTGGGAWETFDSFGVSSGSGTYEVTGFVSFILAAGTFPLTTDDIGNKADAHGGLAVLQIAFSDGSEGVLTVSCHITGTPDSVFEGITVTKDFVDYWNRQAPVPGVNANRTVFHDLD